MPASSASILPTRQRRFGDVCPDSSCSSVTLLALLTALRPPVLPGGSSGCTPATSDFATAAVGLLAACSSSSSVERRSGDAAPSRSAAVLQEWASELLVSCLAGTLPPALLTGWLRSGSRPPRLARPALNLYTTSTTTCQTNPAAITSAKHIGCTSAPCKQTMDASTGKTSVAVTHIADRLCLNSFVRRRMFACSGPVGGPAPDRLLKCSLNKSRATRSSPADDQQTQAQAHTWQVAQVLEL
jgi:hypothetical protein